MISQTALSEFKTIMRDDYGLWLDDAEAMKLAEDYLIALEAVLTPPKGHLTKPLQGEQNDGQ